ncbi:glycosyltransferase family 9 protein [Knoellia sp. CPCC 206450]|uniref:glycosyltransferase family 9 protein n=1 Tax=Knoellia tibetensis TaxID=3404798 RepID=UPI003B42937B
MSTVLVLRALGLGDALTGVPALRGVRRRWPEAELVLAAPPEVGGWLRSLAVVDRVLPTRGLEPLEWDGPPPDVAVNLHGRGPESHRLLLDLAPAELVAFRCDEAGVDDGLPWPDEDHEVDRWVRLVREAGGFCSPEDLRLGPVGRRGHHVVVHPGAASPSRRWPAARWAEVAGAMAGRGRAVVVTGTAPERELCEQVAAAPGVENRCGEDDLAGLDELVGSADLVLCGDTGTAHLATARATPSVLLFGPVAPAAWGPRIDPTLHRVLWRPEASDGPGDPHGSELDPRLAAITVDEVLAAAASLLDEPALSPPRARVP